MDKFEFLEHTADVKMKVHGETLEELFLNGFLGLGEFRACLPAEGGKVERPFRLKAPDAIVLFVEFLQEALSLSETMNELYDSVEFKELSETGCAGKFFGRPILSCKEDIKGVTYHEAEVKKTKNGWEGIIVFDI